ncbi:MAG TPA: ABC transporter permease [Lachnospiraceae bacterium]|nr:ABC transporter permease [Lachnospiraceae bacterium]
MSKDMLTIIRKEFARFFGDKRMVLTTVLLPGFIIYILYSFMGDGFMKEFMTEEGYVAKAYVENMPDELSPMLHELSAEWTEVADGETQDIKTKLENKEADVLVVFPEDFMSDVNVYDVAGGQKAPNVEVYYNSTQTESSNVRGILVNLLDSYEASMANKFDVNSDDQVYDMATEKDATGQIFSMMLPILLMTFMFSGCVSIAPEAIAGEKERGTIATLLVTPMKRSALALGKIISLSCIALLSGLSSFVGTMLSLPKMMGGAVSGMSASVYMMSDYLLLLGIILTTVLVLVSLISVISAFAKSIKEASTAVTPLMIIVMMIGVAPMLSQDKEKSLGIFVIPLYNSVNCMTGIFSFNYQPLQMVITMIVNVLFAGVLAWVLTRLFNDEKVMFSK